MVVKMMKWRPRQSKKLEARITVHRLESGVKRDDCAGYSVEIKWKGAKGISLSSLRKSVRRNFTKEVLLNQHGIVPWDEQFRCFCAFSANKDGLFHPWEVSFTLFNVSLLSLPLFFFLIINILLIDVDSAGVEQGSLCIIKSSRFR